MGIKLSEIEENTRIILHLYNNGNQMDLGGILKKHLEHTLALIVLDYTGTQRLVFDNVTVNLEYTQEDGIPVLWSNVKIVSYKNAYILQASIDGVKNNRRSSYRVPVDQRAWCTIHGQDSQYVTVRDISVSGFSILDRKKELHLPKGSLVSIIFEDLGYRLELDGRVVRIEEKDNMFIYGMAITNLCRDLSAYINIKQRSGRR